MLELELGGGLELLEMRLELLCAVELPDDMALELLARTLELLDRPELLDRGGPDELELGTVLPDVKLELLGAVEVIELLELGSIRVTPPLPDQPDDEDDGSESMVTPVACV